MGAAALCLADFEKAYALGRHDSLVGRPWPGWLEGQFQIHFIYTGVAESMFLIFPDGTTMLLDCGDFSAKFNEPDGTPRFIEDDIADVCGSVNVAKVDHHGHNSMSCKLVAALGPQVWVSCVWDQLHNLPGTMELLSDRSIYPGDRIICPTIMPAERRAADGDAAWMKDIAPEAFEGGHVVVNVEKGGRRYSVAWLTAADESMTVRSVRRFTAR